MTTVILSLHAKQPKRGLIAFDKGYVELYEYPRGQEAVITYTKDGHTETIREGETNRALEYEVLDMEAAVAGLYEGCHGYDDADPAGVGHALSGGRVVKSKYEK